MNDARRISFLTLCLLLYVVANAAILALSDPSCRTLDGACSQQHDRYGVPVAMALVQHGGFVDVTDPTKPYTRWPPAYGIVIAATLIAGATSLLPVVLLQLSALLVTGWLVKLILDEFSPNLGVIGLALTIFNPNSLGGAHLIQAESFQLLFVTLSLFFLLRYCRGRHIGFALASATVLALSTLFRPVTQYLLLLLPLVFAGAAALSTSSWRSFLPGARAGLAATLLALAIVSPWLYHQHGSGEGLRISGRSAELLFFHDNLRFLTPEAPGEGNQAWKLAFGKQRAAFFAETTPGWADLSEQERIEILHADTRSYLLSMPFDTTTLGIALTKSTLRFFVSGGEGEIHSLFGMEYQPEKAPLAFYGIKSISITYALILRLLGLAGIVMLWRLGRYDILWVSCGIVLYFLLAHFVHGKPRFRIPVEAPLAILACFGIACLQTYAGQLRDKVTARD